MQINAYSLKKFGWMIVPPFGKHFTFALIQASLEAETKAKEEALRIKKKIESNINELEIALDHANKANAEAAKQVSVTNPFFISSKLFFDTCFS